MDSPHISTLTMLPMNPHETFRCSNVALWILPHETLVAQGSKDSGYLFKLFT